MAVYGKEGKFFNKKNLVYPVKGLTKIYLQDLKGNPAVDEVSEDVGCKSKC